MIIIVIIITIVIGLLAEEARKTLNNVSLSSN